MAKKTPQYLQKILDAETTKDLEVAIESVTMPDDDDDAYNDKAEKILDAALRSKVLGPWYEHTRQQVSDAVNLCGETNSDRDEAIEKIREASRQIIQNSSRILLYLEGSSSFIGERTPEEDLKYFAVFRLEGNLWNNPKGLCASWTDYLLMCGLKAGRPDPTSDEYDDIDLSIRMPQSKLGPEGVRWAGKIALLSSAIIKDEYMTVPRALVTKGDTERNIAREFLKLQEPATIASDVMRLAGCPCPTSMDTEDKTRDFLTYIPNECIGMLKPIFESQWPPKKGEKRKEILECAQQQAEFLEVFLETKGESLFSSDGKPTAIEKALLKYMDQKVKSGKPLNQNWAVGWEAIGRMMGGETLEEINSDTNDNRLYSKLKARSLKANVKQDSRTGVTNRM